MIGFETAEDDDDDYIEIPMRDFKTMRAAIEEARRLIPSILQMHETIDLLSQLAARKPGPPLTAEHERMARHSAAYEIEHSTEPRVARAAFFRICAQRDVESHQYEWAGHHRRMAEIIEANFQQ